MAYPIIGALFGMAKTIGTKLLPYAIQAGAALIPIAISKLKDWISGNDSKQLANELSQSESFDATKASIAEIQQIRGIISNYKNSSLQKLDDSAEQIVSGFSKMLDFSDELFKDIDENIARDMRQSAKYHFNRAKENLHSGIISQISFDNESLSKILMEDSGEGKRKKVERFINDTNANALRSFQNELENALNASFELTKQKLSAKLEGIKSSAEKSVRFLENYQNSPDKLGKEAQQIALAKSIATNQVAINALQ